MNWNRDKNSSEEKAVNREILLHVGLWGGENLNNELESRQELFGRESCEWRNLLHVELWGGSLNNELESWQELLGREGCEWRNLLLVELLGGKFKQ